jgi:hypothetical protein
LGKIFGTLLVVSYLAYMALLYQQSLAI